MRYETQIYCVRPLLQVSDYYFNLSLHINISNIRTSKLKYVSEIASLIFNINF